MGRWLLTSCSDRGIFWSFILWTAAEAEPSMAVAAITEAPFIFDDFKFS